MHTVKADHSVRYFVISVICLIGVVALGVTLFPTVAQSGDLIGQRREPNREIEGDRIFLTYCAGCHGFDGFAAYPPAPSFAMGERLFKDDNTLLESVLKGKNGMPPWQDKLPRHMLSATIAYLRTMNSRRIAGLAPRVRPIPDIYFKFRPVGSTDPYLWHFTGH